MRKIYLLFLMLLLPWVHNAQINYSYGWEPTGLGSWVNSGSASMGRTTTAPCEGTASVRTNFYFDWDWYYYYDDNIFRSPSLGTSNQGLVTVNLSYKVINYSSTATPASYFKIKMQWANATTGPWNDFYEINSSNHTASTTCSTVTATFVPSAGDTYMRFVSEDLSDGDGDYYIYFDNVNVTQGATPTCFRPTDILVSDVNSNSATISWSAPTNIPSDGYIYEVRTDENPGTSGSALIASGTTLSGVVTASISNLSELTNYNVYVRSNCGSGDLSFWSSKVAFRTTCDNEIAPTAVETFSTYTGSISTTSLPCWQERVGANIGDALTGTTSSWSWEDYNNSSSNPNGKALYINLYGDDKEWMISPSIDLGLASGPNFRLKYDVSILPYSSSSSVTSMGADKSVTVLISTDNGQTWSTTNILKVYNNSNIPYNLVNPETIDLSAYSGVVKFAFFAKSTSTSTDFRFYIDNFVVEPLPTCPDITGFQVSNVTKNTAKLSWNVPNLLPGIGYEYEVRTSGEPGTPGAIFTGAVSSSESFHNLGNLLPSSQYTVYLRAVCSVSQFGSWSLGALFTTLCSYPDLVSAPPVTRCGIGTVNLSADFNSSHVFWFDNAVSGNVLAITEDFTTPQLSATTTYYATGGNVSTTPSLINAGAGDLTSNTYSNPFYSAWSNNHTQHLITARELLNYGVGPGAINSIALDVTSIGTLPMINLSIKVGTTTRSALETFDTSAVMTSVYTSASYLPTAGVNTFVFTTPFVWDGKSSIIIEFCHGNSASSATMSRTIKSVATPYKSTVKAHVTSSTSAETVCANTSSNLESYLNRPQFIFNANTVCVNTTGTAVVATVTPAPVLTLSTNSVEICEGQTSTVTVTAGAADYNTFVWFPATGVTGNATSGWVFNPTESTVYTLTASQTAGSLCSNVLTVDVTVNPLPLMLDLGEAHQVCAGTVLQLKVGDNTVWPSNYFNSFESTQVQGFVASATGGVSANTTNLVASVGARSLQITHASSASGYVTLSNSLDLSSFTAPYLTFSHIAALEGSGTSYDYGYVEYSLDGGTTWVVFKPADYVGTAEAVGSTATIGQRFSTRSYTEWIDVLTSSTVDPTNALWKPARFNFPTNGDLSNVKIRFKVTSDSSTSYAGWFIDNVNIKEAPLTTAIWTPATNLYTDAAATVPYVAGSDAAIVYFKSAVAMAETDYEVTVISAADCSVTQTVAITNVFVDTPVAADQSFCDEVEVSDVIVTGLTTGAALKWYASETSTTEITSIAATGTYYVVQELNGCSSSRVAVEIELNGVNVAPVAPANQNFCGIATVSDLEVTALTGNTIGWFGSETSTTELTSTTGLTSGVYYVSQYNGHCWSPRASVTVSVVPVPSAPAVTAQNFCGTRPLSEINFGQASNATLKWYETATSTAVLPMTLPVATGTYYVSQTIGGCESSRVAVSVTILDVLPAPAAPASQLYCGSTSISDLAATAVSGGTIGWFSSMTSTTPIASTQNVSTGTYYVAQFNGACWSDKTTVQVTVGTVPPAPSNANVQLCGNYNFGQVSIGQISGATLNWYETSTSTTPLGSSTNVVGGTYYVSQTVGGCESARVMITITQTDALSNPTAVSQTFCGSATVADLVAQGSVGSTLVWYNSSVALNPLSPSAALATGTYYAAQTRNGCFSARVPISVFVVSVAGPNVDTFNFCGSAKVSDLVLPTPTGVVYKWFNSPSSSTQLDADTALASGTYFVSRTQFGCESARTAVTVNINSVPDAPTGISPQTFIQGSTINDIVMNQPNVVWYISEQNARNGVNSLVQGMPLVNGTTYYGVIIGTNGCPSLPFALTVDVYLSDDKFVKEELKYYPNPVEDLLTISYSDRILQIEVFDLLGKRVKARSTDDKEVKIDLSDLASGTYMIQLKTENKSQFLKIIKK